MDQKEEAEEEKEDQKVEKEDLIKKKSVGVWSGRVRRSL